MNEEFTVVTSFSPGRLEWLGNHTDYNNGVALSVAIDLGVTAVVTRRGDRQVRLRSASREGVQSFKLDELTQQIYGGWFGYVLGVVDLFKSDGLIDTGLDVEVRSTLPEGAGLSSSAALECAVGLALLKLSGAKMNLLELAKLCQKAEHYYVGTQCGLLDQISSLAARSGEALVIDFRSLQYHSVKLPEGLCFLVVPSGVKHSLVAGEYNVRKASCEAAARAMGVPDLASADVEMLKLHRGVMDDRVYRRALHVLGEITRVKLAISFLEAGDITSVGRLMWESHKSSQENFQNSCAELDGIVEWFARDGRALGARLSGGGFGGSAIVLCREELAEDLIEDYMKAYGKALGDSRPMLCRAGVGGWELAALP